MVNLESTAKTGVTLADTYIALELYFLTLDDQKSSDTLCAPKDTSLDVACCLAISILTR
jgi:hypothetical protein